MNPIDSGELTLQLAKRERAERLDTSEMAVIRRVYYRSDPGDS
jgi:hypothetical protein